MNRGIVCRIFYGLIVLFSYCFLAIQVRAAVMEVRGGFRPAIQPSRMLSDALVERVR